MRVLQNNDEGVRDEMKEKHRAGLALLLAIVIILGISSASPSPILYIVFMLFAMIGLALLMSD